MADEILQVLGGLSPFAVLVGVWLGKRWERSGATASWRRDRRCAAYIRLLDAFRELENDGLQALSKDARAERTVHAEKMAGVEGRLGPIQSAIRLLGTPEAANAADAAIVAHAERTHRIIEAYATIPEGQVVDYSDSTGAMEAETVFVAAAQKALQ